jgi:hypothetical protein
VVISESLLAGSLPRILSISLEPLGSIPLAGRVTGASPGPLEIEVKYLARWGHKFFGINDGIIASFRVASTELGSDGTFTTSVPDLANDPVVSRYNEAERGVFRLRAREPQTGNIAFSLETKDGQPGMGVPIAKAYAGELQFGIRK